MAFEKEKKEFLDKKDKSKKGSVDEPIRGLIDTINSLEDFCTTSSCSGRILLFTVPKSNKKNEVEFLFCSHKKIHYNQIKKAIISNYNKKNIEKNDVWLKVQPAILHVSCKNIDCARRLLNTARGVGFRRSGIISIGKSKIIVELISTERIEAIASKNGKLVIDEEYFKVLVKEGNKKLEKTWEKIDKLNVMLKK